MLETVLAVFGVTLLFLALFKLTSMMSAKIMLEHAAMRVARAKAVGCNDFHCLKAARVAVIPAAGERLWPEKDDPRTAGASESAMARMYLRTPDGDYANGLLRYEGWKSLTVERHGGAWRTRMSTADPDVDEADGCCNCKKTWFTLEGEAVVDDFPKYMNNQGL